MIGTIWCVPGVVAVCPGKWCLEGAEEIIEGPSDDKVVVGAHDERDGH